MRKSIIVQIALLFSGILIIVLLFQQPKFIVEDEKKATLESTTQEHQVSISSQSHSISEKLENTDLINSLVSKYLTESISEKKAIFADSIAEQYRKSFVFDSSAHYFELAFIHNSEEESLEKATLGIYEAFQNSGIADKRKELGKKAIGFLDKMLDSHSDRVDLQIKKAVVQVYTEPMPMAGIGALKDIIAKNPNNTEARLYLGEFQFTVGKYDLAVEQFKTVHKINPSELKALMYLTDCYLALGKVVKAEEYLKILKELDIKDSYIGSTIEKFEQEIKSLKN